MAKNNVKIAFITDEYYAIPTYVTICSMKKSKLKTSRYNIYVIYTDVNESFLNNLLQLHSQDFKIKTIKVDNEFSDLDLSNIHVSTAAILKFKLDSILSNLNKVLYLDGDLIIQHDLSDLYNTNISNKYAGVVKDIAPMILYQPTMNKKLGITHRHYFNSGVMLLNLKKIRLDNIQNKLIDYRKNGLNFFMDQDALNVCFQDNVEYLDIKNNFLVTLLDRFSIEEICKYYNTSVKDSFSNSVILHFCSKFKPWKYYDINFFDIWNDVYKETPYKEYYDRTYINTNPLIISLTSYPARIKTVNQTIESLLNQTHKADKVILWLAPEQFPNRESDLPQQLLDLRDKGLTIDWYHDIKSYKKLIPALQKYPDATIVTTDDDVIYDKDMFESYKIEPNAIHCHRAHLITMSGRKINKYNDFVWTNKLPRHLESDYKLFFTGVGGVLYPPRCLHNNVLNETEFMSLCPHGDDIWFWGNAVLNTTKIKLITNRIAPQLIEGTQEVALWQQNVKDGKNDIQIANLVKKYPKILKILLPKKKINLKPYLLFPYYLGAMLVMKFIILPRKKKQMARQNLFEMANDYKNLKAQVRELKSGLADTRTTVKRIEGIVNQQ